MATSTSPKRVLNIDTLAEALQAAKTWTTSPPMSADTIVKIVIGPSPDPLRGVERWSVDLAGMDWNVFPNLTHLYLWSLDGLVALQGLPDTLQVLDVRGCRHLQTIHPLPAVREFIADGCEALVELKGVANWQATAMTDLSMQHCETMPSLAIQRLLEHANGTIEKLNLSKTKLEHLRTWPPRARSVILNDCHNLRTVPSSVFPHLLTRFEVARTQLTVIPKLTPNLDYVNLAGIRERAGIETLDKDWTKTPTTHRTPRTLFLHDSGLLRPPASEHGEDSADNVAATVREFFEDIDLAGKSSSSRCKVVFLGNGDAGKTSLCQLLCGRDPNHGLGSTHGVRLETDSREITENDGRQRTIAVDYWDFGGQDLYHNVHRMFTSTGSVFVLLWDPYGRMPSEGNGGPYHDTPRTLPYWLELIRTSTRSKPKVLVVCQGRGVQKPRAMNLLRRDVTRELIPDTSVFVIDTWATYQSQRNEEFLRFQRSLDQCLLDVVEKEGDEIPSHWVLARESADELRGKGKRFCAITEFETNLRTRIEREQNNPATLYGTLAQAWGTQFHLTPRRVRRALLHLSHNGSLFWHPNLEEPNTTLASNHAAPSVILDQNWALRGVYALLDRQAAVYSQFRQAQGRFTVNQLAEWCWSDCGYDDTQQAVLLRYMDRLGICFPLISANDASRGEAVYVSVEHLPSAASELRERFERAAKGKRRASGSVSIKGPFSLGWKQLLAFLGKQYGRAATYASDAFFFAAPGAGSTILIASKPSGTTDIDGTLQIDICEGESSIADRPRATSPDSPIEKRVEDLISTLGVIADPKTSQRIRDERANGARIAGEPASRTLFISYAWNPTEGLEQCARPHDPLVSLNDSDGDDLESPIDEIEEAVRQRSPHTCVVRDKYLPDGNDIDGFMQQISKADVVLVFHSDRYWKRAFCMYELFKLFLPKPHETILYVGHHSSRAASESEWHTYEEYWDATNSASLPPALKNKITLDALHAFIKHTWWGVLWPSLFQHKNHHPNMVWGPATKSGIIEHIVTTLDGRAP